MEEIYPELGQDVGELLKNMYLKVQDDGDPVITLVNEVRVIMFREKTFVDPHYDGPK